MIGPRIVNAPQLYTPAEAAALLRMKESTLRRQATAHAVPHRRIGRRIAFSAADIEQIVNDAECAPVTALRRRRGAA